MPRDIGRVKVRAAFQKRAEVISQELGQADALILQMEDELAQIKANRIALDGARQETDLWLEWVDDDQEWENAGDLSDEDKALLNGNQELSELEPVSS